MSKRLSTTVKGKPQEWAATLAFLKSLVDAGENEAALVVDPGVTLTTRFEQKLPTLLDLIPGDEFILNLCGKPEGKLGPVVPIPPRSLLVTDALYLSPTVKRRLAEVTGDALRAWKKGDATHDIKLGTIVRRFAENEGIPIYAADMALPAPLNRTPGKVLYIGEPKPLDWAVPERICTFVTESCLKEALLLLKSLELFQPTTPVYVLGDNESVRAIMDEFPRVGCRVAVTKEDIARRRNEWLKRTASADDIFQGLMSFKMDAIEFAGGRSIHTLFVDADVVFLDPFPSVPRCDFALAPHNPNPTVPDPVGTYNAGVIFVGSRDFLDWWRDTYMNAPLVFGDQGCLDDAASLFDLHILGATVNFGSWRLWNFTKGAAIDHFKSPPEVICSFAGLTVGEGIFMHGKPLQSMHVHNFRDMSGTAPHNTGGQRVLRYVLSKSRRPEHRELFNYYEELDERPNTRTTTGN